MCACPPSNSANGTDRYLEKLDGERRGVLYFWTKLSQGVPGETASVGSPSSDGTAGEAS